MIERELIAAVLSRPEVLWECPVQPEHFESEVHGQIWRTILDLQHKGESFDAVTVSQSLGGDAGDRAITYVNEAVGSAAAAPGYASRIIEGWRNRMASDIYAKAQSGEISRDDAIRELMALDDEESTHETNIKQAMRKALDDMEEAAAAGGGIRGITTGLKDLDRHLGGLHNGDLTIIGARPSHGKTALLLHIAQCAGVPLGMVSAEMPDFQLAQRHAASIGRVSLANIRQGKVGKDEMAAFVKANRQLRDDYHLLDRGSPHIDEVIKVARKWHHKYQIQLFLVDYIQRITGRGDSKAERVADVAKSLKTIARDLNIPVVALAQVKRDVDSRSDKRPGMADLYYSSELEMEADQVITLYRDEVYNSDSPDKGMAELSICKNRAGYCGTVKVSWAGEFVSFGDLAWQF
jgi:replicative DNA helicase